MYFIKYHKISGVGTFDILKGILSIIIKLIQENFHIKNS